MLTFGTHPAPGNCVDCRRGLAGSAAPNRVRVGAVCPQGALASSRPRAILFDAFGVQKGMAFFGARW
jgi:hypothetical protein